MDATTYPRMNKVFLTGLAQEEPELRYTPSGVSVSSFRVQVGRLLRDRSGGAREVAAYLTIVAWQETAQRMSRELRKGQAIYVEGYVSSRSFTTARGDKRTAIEIYAEQIQILGPFSDEEKPEPPTPSPARQQPGQRRPPAPQGGAGAQTEGAGAQERKESTEAAETPADKDPAQAAEPDAKAAELPKATDSEKESTQTEPTSGSAETDGNGTVAGEGENRSGGDQAKDEEKQDS